MAQRKSGGFIELVKTFVYAGLIALVIRTLLFEPFSIPSGSMIPTLLVGDYLFVSKFAYGYSRHTVAFGLPLFDGRVLGSPPERGDVVVFRLPRDPSQDYIKRIVGLPGDRIQMIGGVLHINGEAVTPEAPERLLVISGQWEPALREEALEAVRQLRPDAEAGVTVRADGIARRAVVAPFVEHVGVLYSRETLDEIVAWLDATFGVEQAGDPYIDRRGPLILLLLSAMLPNVAAQTLEERVEHVFGVDVVCRQFCDDVRIEVLVDEEPHAVARVGS